MEAPDFVRKIHACKL